MAGNSNFLSKFQARTDFCKIVAQSSFYCSELASRLFKIPIADVGSGREHMSAKQPGPLSFALGRDSRAEDLDQRCVLLARTIGRHATPATLARSFASWFLSSPAIFFRTLLCILAVLEDVQYTERLLRGHSTERDGSSNRHISPHFPPFFYICQELNRNRRGTLKHFAIVSVLSFVWRTIRVTDLKEIFRQLQHFFFEAFVVFKFKIFKK